MICRPRPARGSGQAAVVIVAMLLVTVMLAGPARAATLTVTNTNDAADGSLRQRIASAAPGDTIVFSVSGAITLTSGQLVVNKDLTIAGPGAKDLTVSGNNQSRVFEVASEAQVEISGLTITGGRVAGSSGSSGANGFTSSNGGTNGQAGGSGGDAGGGGILNNGTLTLREVSVSANTATGGAGGAGGRGGDGLDNTCSSSDNGGGGSGGSGGGARGGGILNEGTLTLHGTIVSSNTALGGQGGGGGQGGRGGDDGTFCTGGNGGRGGDGGAAGAGRGGAVFNSGTLDATNSTLDGGSARGGAGGAGGQGGAGGSAGIRGNGGNGGSGEGGATHGSGPSAALTNATVSANQALSGPGGARGFGGSGSTNGAPGFTGSAGAGRGGGVFGGGATALGNTIVAPNTASTSGADIFGAFASRGHNLVGDATGASGFVASDIQNGDPGLGPLQDNGGQTMTRALQGGSGSVDAADTALAPTKDQRGMVRPQGTTADIGALEVDVAPTVTTATPPRTAKARANVVASFSEPMDPTTIAGSTFTLKKGTQTVRARVSLDPTGKKATLNPRKDLQAGAKYTATVVTAAKDLWGTALDQDPNTTGDQPKSWTFKVRR